MQMVYKKSAFIHPKSISNLRHFILWFASLYPAICVKSARNLRHFTRSLMLFRTLIPYLWPPLRPQMMALGTISDVMKPFERREHRFFTTLFFAKTQKKVNVILSNSFIKNSPFHATNRNEQKTHPYTNTTALFIAQQCLWNHDLWRKSRPRG